VRRCGWVRDHLVDYVCGRLTRDLNGAVAEHLQNCPACWKLQADISDAAAALRRVRPSEPPPKTLVALRRRLASVGPVPRQAVWLVAARRFATVAAIAVAIMIASAPWVYVAYSTDTARVTSEMQGLRDRIARTDLMDWLGTGPASVMDAKTLADARLLLQEVVNTSERGSVSQVEAGLLRERVVQSNLLGRVQALVARATGPQRERLRELSAVLQGLARL